MSRVIVEVTARQLLARRRMLLLAALALLPVVLAGIFRAAADGDNPTEWTVDVLAELVVASILPLVAVVFGTATLGAEVEDGTAFYILAKPIQRSRIVLSKLLVAAAGTAALVLPAIVACGIIGMWGEPQEGVVVGFAVAAAIGAIAYTCLFFLFSVLTSRALIAGLVYVFIWEGVATRLFSGLRVLSVREYTMGIADLIATVPDEILDANLDGGTALALAVVVSFLLAWYSVRRLERLELREAV